MYDIFYNSTFSSASQVVDAIIFREDKMIYLEL